MSSKKKKHTSSSSDSLMSWLNHISLSIIYGVLFMFLIANIIYSQFMPEQYFSLLQGKDGVIVQILQKGKDITYFRYIFPEVRNAMKANEAEIFAETNSRRAQIEILEKASEQTPESRDILYLLSVLYSQEGFEDRARYYLERARQIDPTIGFEKTD